MNEERTQAIVLRSQDYKENQRIITAFSFHGGMISLVIKGISRRNTRLLALTSPFSEIEVLFNRGRSELFSFIDGTTIDEHLSLRQKLSSLEAAGSLAQAILSSQLAGKPAVELYCLFRAYLKRIPSFEHPFPLLASFQLKLLKHEGLLALSYGCARCKDKRAHILSKGESLCNLHTLDEGLCFSEPEWQDLLALHEAKHFSDLRSFNLTPALSQKISLYFKQRLIQQ